MKSLSSAIRHPLLVMLLFILGAGFLTTAPGSVKDAVANDTATYTFTFENVNVRYITEIRIEARKREGGGYAPYDSAYRGPTWISRRPVP